MVICCFFINVFINFSRPSPSAEAVCFKNSDGVFLELLKNSNWNTRWLWNHPRIHKELCCRLLFFQNSDRRSWCITMDKFVPFISFCFTIYFLTFFCRFLNPNNFCHLSCNCYNISDLRNLQEQIKKEFCFKNCTDLSVFE